MNKDFPIDKIERGPIRHEKLDDSQSKSATRSWNIIAKHLFDSYGEFVDEFLRDIYPNRELVIWAKMANAFETYVQRHNVKDENLLKFIAGTLLVMSMGGKATQPSDPATFPIERELRELYYGKASHGRFGRGKCKDDPNS